MTGDTVMRAVVRPLVYSLLTMALIAPGCTPKQAAIAPEGQADALMTMYEYAACMREHGITNYPDPTEDGINLKGTGIDRDSPEFKAAEEACGMYLPGGGSQPPVPQGSPPVEDQAQRGRSDIAVAWERITPGSPCECADGSAYAFFSHHADPTKVLFYLDGGGVCFDAASCANANTPGTGERPGPDYDPNIEGENPAMEGGLLDLGRPDNPFHNFSAIYVPQCTADGHLGDATHEYAPGLTVHHKGLVNGTAALDYLIEHFPNATQVVVIGHTTIATPLYGGIVKDRLSNARVVALGSQAGTVPASPDLNAKIGAQWGTYDRMPQWEANKDITPAEWGAQQMWISAGLQHPDLILARFDYAFDPNAAETLAYLAVPGVDPANTLAVIDANEAAIENGGVTLRSYTAPGRHHGILEFSKFYDLEVNGVKFADWVTALVKGKPMEDVRCTECAE